MCLACLKQIQIFCYDVTLHYSAPTQALLCEGDLVSCRLRLHQHDT